jgi:hypothetical protein
MIMMMMMMIIIIIIITIIIIHPSMLDLNSSVLLYNIFHIGCTKHKKGINEVEMYCTKCVRNTTKQRQQLGFNVLFVQH